MPDQRTERERLIAFAPKVVSLSDDVLFGDIWERPQLSKRDRSLVTVSALIALSRTEQMGSHMRRAVANGLTVEELVEAITHLAFYAGWPAAMTALRVAQSIFDVEPEQQPG
jgi:4-carboxymuconolactone decarboxylase